MKIVIAPDSFKESLPAAAVAEAIASGVLEVVAKARVDLCPMADGGEGTVEAIVAATAGEIHTADVFGPLGEQRRAKFGLLGSGGGAGLPGEVGLSAAMGLADGEGTALERDGGKVAVIEMATASGLGLVRPELRDPLRTTTFGTGQLITAALDAGAREIIIGIGGSATVDGGCGCAQALGVTFVDANGQGCVCGIGGGGLRQIVDIDMSDCDPRLGETRIRVACDVTSPLTGPAGAAKVFGPQKGATPEIVEQLENNLTHLAGVIRDKLGLDLADLPGAGAAGGLGAGLVAFAGASLEEGFGIVATAVGLSRRLTGADLCITGEGTLDGQSECGKAAIGVARLCRLAGVPVVCIPGQVAHDAPSDRFDAVYPLVNDDVKPAQAMAKPEAFIARRAAQAIREFLARS